MKEQIEFRGFWKLPLQEKFHKAGILTYNPESNRIILRLLGTFSSEKDRLFEEYYDQIDGFSENGRKITLLDCSGNNSESIPGIRSSEFQCSKLIISQNLQFENNFKYKYLNIRLDYFDAFVNKSGFEEYFKKEEGRTYVVEYKKPKNITLYKSSEFEIYIHFTYERKFSNTKLERNYNQISHLNVKFKDSVGLSIIEGVLYKIQTLISLALSSPIEIIEMFGLNEADETLKSDQIILTTRLISESKTKSTDTTCLFNLDDILDTQALFEKWISNFEVLKPISDLLMDSFYNQKLYNTARFLNLIFALETFHRRIIGGLNIPEEEYKTKIDEILENVPIEHNEWLRAKLQYGNELPLRKRLKMMIEEVFEIIEPFLDKVGGKKRFLFTVVDNRNYHVHYGMHLEGKSIAEDELYKYNILMEILLKSILMKFLDFDHKQIQINIRRPLIHRIILSNKN